MSVKIKVIDAYRNKHIPERFLSGVTQSTLDMFENQICVRLSATHDAYVAKYEIEDEIRAAFMFRLDEWIREFPTKASWSAVSHGTTSNNEYDYISAIGFIFVDFEDSENFLKHFILIDKLKS